MMRLRILAAAGLASAVVAGGWSHATQMQVPRVSAQDFTEIQDLLWTNHTGYDFAQRDNGDMWTSTFLPDAVLDNGSTHLEGQTAIRRYATDYYKADPKRILRHWTSTFHVTPNAVGATLSAFYFTMTQDQGKPGLNIGVAGRYESLVVKTDAGWRLKHHVVYGEGAVSLAPRTGVPAPIR
ncbi:MAG TPA: nuclear transport factor 2 family protein [Vicinamibacterales bacterium]|nr:nuclear transport factor 2 family protein [Vicinamibacterales bacterium]